MKLRLHGTAAECAEATRRLAQVFQVVAVSPPYPDRGPSHLVRVYVEVRLWQIGTSPPGAPARPRAVSLWCRTVL